jgi:hypothetical protein
MASLSAGSRGRTVPHLFPIEHKILTRTVPYRTIPYRTLTYRTVPLEKLKKRTGIPQPPRRHYYTALHLLLPLSLFAFALPFVCFAMHWNSAPPEILLMIGRALEHLRDPSAVARARLTCKAWAASVSHGLTEASVGFAHPDETWGLPGACPPAWGTRLLSGLTRLVTPLF